MISFPKAKINLGLRVLNRRPDGYHNIDSVFYPVDIHDVLEIIVAPDQKFHYSGSGLDVLGNTEENLVVRAFRMMQTRFKLPEVHIHLHKVIPMGSGIGGGSSDASSTILLVNRLFQLNLKYSEMKDLSAEIGSDCPFFIDPRPTMVSGRGERLEPVCLNLAQYNFLLVFPGIFVSTKEAYSRIVPGDKPQELSAILSQPINQWKHILNNDFEPVIFQKYPELGIIKQDLYKAGALYAAMSGSGSAIYGIFEHNFDAAAFSGHYYTYLCKAKA